ncbi:hypothetical protein HaLaN_21499 [Haematococcus lacustris]|uniref:Uncharacterized protein n=1 Tax=Haematococcus lacustris TaxID=44745 RepID=A0A699ZLZ0_HAELA|nr:hypothetical protein HaLaN_21499 [Haematococcus lacustris]
MKCLRTTLLRGQIDALRVCRSSQPEQKPLQLKQHMWQGSDRTSRQFCSLQKGTTTYVPASGPWIGGVEGEAEADPWLREKGRHGVLGGGGTRRGLSVAKRDGRLITLAGLEGVGCEVMGGDGGWAGVGDGELAGVG